LERQKKYYFELSAFIALFFTIGLVPNSHLRAQFIETAGSTQSPKTCTPINEFNFFSGQPSPVINDIPGLEGETKAITPSHKSVFVAGLLSFILPGLGEYYVGDQIWRGVIFTVLDAGLWYEHYHYIGRGNDSNTAFQNFSDKYWSPQRYADTLNFLLNRAGKNFQVVNANDFSQINKAEDSLAEFYPNFTHQLPAKGSQGFYEIISKYIQYTPGWQDNVDGNPLHSGEYQTAANMRADMNHQFEIADDFLYGLLLNRVLSVIDAALLAKNHNSAIHLEGELHQSRYPDGTMGFIPTAHLTYKF
jgi:hypothetical protein